jgi:hypothetical protein
MRFDPVESCAKRMEMAQRLGIAGNRHAAHSQKQRASQSQRKKHDTSRILRC